MVALRSFLNARLSAGSISTLNCKLIVAMVLVSADVGWERITDNPLVTRYGSQHNRYVLIIQNTRNVMRRS